MLYDGQYSDVAARLSAEFDPINFWMESMTRLICVTRGTHSFQVDIVLEGAGEDVWEQQVIQTFLLVIPATLSWEAQRMERNTLEELCQEAELQATLENDPLIQAMALTIKENPMMESTQQPDERRCCECTAL